MKKSILTVAAIATVFSFSSCKETTAQTTEETVEEVSAINTAEEEILEEGSMMEAVNDSTAQVESTEAAPTEIPESDKE